MKIVEDKLTNLLFKISIAVGLGGILMYLFKEMIYSFQAYAYTVFIAIADFIGMLAIIAIIVWMFIPKHKLILLNLIFLLGIGYIILFVFANFFITNYFWATAIPGWFTADYFGRLSIVGISFIGILLVTLLSVCLFVIFSIGFGKRDQFGIFEKFVIVLWFLMIGIFDFSANFGLRNREVFAAPLLNQLGVTFLPNTIEFILLLFVAILLVMNFFVGVNEKILALITLLLVNTFFLTLTITSANYISFTFNSGVDALSIIGNIFVIIGTIGLLVSTFLVLRIKYPKSLAKRSKG